MAGFPAQACPSCFLEKEGISEDTSQQSASLLRQLLN